MAANIRHESSAWLKPGTGIPIIGGPEPADV
jgi:hypothetical protein